MVLSDKLFLISTTLISAASVGYLLLMHNKEGRSRADIYHSLAQAVLGVAALLLAIYGWGILGMMGEGTGNKLVAIISSCIPFAWAIGLVSTYFPKIEKSFLLLMIFGLLLIAVSRFVNAPVLARIVHPVFHSVAAIVVVTTPIIALRKGLVSYHFLAITLGGVLISTAGISLAFLSGGKQLLFFSQDVVLRIFAPLLFATSGLYAWGLLKGESQ